MVGVAPFPGAETGTGGRIRDTHATGRGSIVLGATVGYLSLFHCFVILLFLYLLMNDKLMVYRYCVGNLQIPGYELPWEDKEYHII